MAFFGCEVKPNTPFSFGANPIKGRLHLSLATLGMGSSTNKSILQCISGDARPVFLCSLFPEKYETCQINLEFEEADDVVFSVIGPRSIHITGYFLGSVHHHQLKDDSESYGEDIAATESERLSDDEDYGGSFINDGDPGVYSASSGSVDEVEEVSNPNKPVKASRRRLRKKYQPKDSGSNDEDRSQQCEDPDPRHRDSVSNSDLAGSPFLSSSLLKKSSNEGIQELKKKKKKKKIEEDNPRKVYVSDSDSTGGFFISSSSLLNKSSNKALTKKKEEDNQNMDQVVDSSVEPKREALDEDTQELKKKKKKKERKKRKLALVEGAESVGTEKNGEDPEKIESNNKIKRKKRRDKSRGGNKSD